MWDLNDCPETRIPVHDEDIVNDDEKGKRVGSGSVTVSNSSSSAVMIDDGASDGDDVINKRSKIFGFSVDDSSPDSLVTHNFFPMELDPATSSASSLFPRAHWVGVKFCQSESLPGGNSLPAPAEAASATVKKSRRGPRSRSSQYRGVTFYRRTGRWESHIW